MEKVKKHVAFTPLLSTVSSDSGLSVCSPGAPSVAQIKRKAPVLFIPSLEYLTVQEFEAVPK